MLKEELLPAVIPFQIHVNSLLLKCNSFSSDWGPWPPILSFGETEIIGSEIEQTWHYYMALDGIPSLPEPQLSHRKPVRNEYPNGYPEIKGSDELKGASLVSGAY